MATCAGQPWIAKASHAAMPSQTDGFDACDQGSLTPSEMSYLWSTYGRLYSMHYYLGGENSCSVEPTVNGSPSEWLEYVEADSAWAVVFTWYGLQCANLLSYSTSQAQAQGTSDAYSAYHAALNVIDGHFATYPLPIALDIEGYGDSSCRSAVDAYVNGWDLGASTYGFQPVVYGSANASNPLDWATLSNVPYAVWLRGNQCSDTSSSDYNYYTTSSPHYPTCWTYDSVWSPISPYLSNDAWDNDQRYSQYVSYMTFTGIPGWTQYSGVFYADIDCDDSRAAIHQYYEGSDDAYCQPN